MADFSTWDRATLEQFAQEATDKLIENRAAIAELIEAGRAVVERWESPLWKDLPNTGEYIYALRDVIAKHDITTKEGN